MLCVSRNSKELPVSFSCQLQPREAKYSALELECLAVVEPFSILRVISMDENLTFTHITRVCVS